MARPENMITAGYVKTPVDIVDMISTWVGAPYDAQGYPVYLADPCAGEGEAITRIAESLGRSSRVAVCELEKTRYSALQKVVGSGAHKAHGDFFHLDWGQTQVSFVYLNPPYDTDPEYGRLEERFLLRAKDLLATDGWLAFVVPFHALLRSAHTLSNHFSDVSCYRFPGDHWDAYKQVVLFARRRADTISRPPEAGPLQETIEGWAKDPSTLPDLFTRDTPEIELMSGYPMRVDRWDMGELDLKSLKEDFDPWLDVPGVEIPADLARHFRRVFPVASRPRASHLAGALAAGIFNGIRIVPNDPASGLPEVLIKGVFDKEFRKVEDKVNKHGEVVAEVQVQQPKLSVCILDLSKGEYHVVSTGGKETEPGEAVSVDNLSMRGVLQHYGESLMAGMVKACPVLADDPDYPDVQFPPLVRQPYPAQETVIQTLVKLRKKYPRAGSVLLGEVGSGKSICALTTAIVMGYKRPLIMCPPHLLDGWVDEANATWPEARTIILDSITAAREFATTPEDGPVIGILSREKAKLSHKWESVSGRCPKCYGDLKKKNYATKRETCTHYTLSPDDEISEWLQKIAAIVRPYLPEHDVSRTFTQGRYLRNCKEQKEWTGVPPELADILLEMGVADLGQLFDGIDQAISWLDPSLAMDLAEQDHAAGRYSYWKILMGSDDPSGFSHRGPWSGRVEFEAAWKWSRGEGGASSWSFKDYATSPEGPTYKKALRGSLDALTNLLEVMTAYSSYTKVVCGEPLYQAVPKPRRVALATWIKRYHPRCYDMFIFDECHEAANKDTAQSAAACRLMNTNAHILQLTGTFMNGYASSVFMNTHAVSPDFRADFSRDDMTRFIDRFGYWKRIETHKDWDGEVVEFGSQSDRVTRSYRKAGVAPGILPLFNLEYLLPISVTLQKADLALGIPPRTDEGLEIEASYRMNRNFETLKSALVSEINKSRFSKDLAGKLWGAMARLPSYFDLASVGNTDEGVYEIKWPKGVPEVGGNVIASVPLLDPSQTLPKEEWMLERVAEEIAEGRNVIVFTTHTKVMPRVADLLREAGHKVEVLYASKVPTAKRLKWITTKVVKKKVQVLVVNPVAVQTGLNNLVHFSTQIWLENPMCNPNVYRQGCGRVDRIGQKQPTRIVFPAYYGVQEKARSLLMHKVGVSTAVDGLDPEEALRAAGLVDSDYVAFSVGKELYKMYEEGGL